MSTEPGTSGCRATPQQEDHSVSVIVPTYNRPRWLRRALRSLAAQTHAPAEVVVVNDGGESVQSVIEEFRPVLNVVPVSLPRNRGASAARNAGLERASGALVAYLDDDDLFYPHHLSTLVAAMAPGTDFAFSDACRATRAHRMGRELTISRDLVFGGDFDLDKALVRPQFKALCVLHRRACLGRTGTFDESLRRMGDWDLWLRFAAHAPLRHVSRVTAEYTCHAGAVPDGAMRAPADEVREVYRRTQHLVTRPDLERQRAEYLRGCGAAPGEDRARGRGARGAGRWRRYGRKLRFYLGDPDMRQRMRSLLRILGRAEEVPAGEFRRQMGDWERDLAAILEVKAHGSLAGLLKQPWLFHPQSPPRLNLEAARLALMKKVQFDLVVPWFAPETERLEKFLAAVDRQVFPPLGVTVVCDEARSLRLRQVLGDLELGFPHDVDGRPEPGLAEGIASAVRGGGGSHAVVMSGEEHLEPDALWQLAEHAVQLGEPAMLWVPDSPEVTLGKPGWMPEWSPGLAAGGRLPSRCLAIPRAVEASGRSWRSAALEDAIPERLAAAEDDGIPIRRTPFAWPVRGHRINVPEGWVAQPLACDPGERTASGGSRKRESVLVVIPTKNRAADLERCLAGIAAGIPAGDVSVVVVDNGSDDPRVRLLTEKFGARLVSDPRPFNYSAMNNMGAAAQDSDIVLFLNNDTVPIRPDWMGQLADEMQRPGVGIAGGLLLYPDGSVQHGGMPWVADAETFGHGDRYAQCRPGDPARYSGRPRDLLCVTGACLAIRRSVFARLGGFDEQFPRICNDTDLCLRCWAAGYRVRYTPFACLHHLEGVSVRSARASLAEDQERFRERWPKPVIERLGAEIERGWWRYGGAPDLGAFALPQPRSRMP